MGFQWERESETIRAESLFVLKEQEWMKEPGRLQSSAGRWYQAIWPSILNGKFPSLQNSVWLFANFTEFYLLIKVWMRLINKCWVNKSLLMLSKMQRSCSLLSSSWCKSSTRWWILTWYMMWNKCMKMLLENRHAIPCLYYSERKTLWRSQV